MKNLVEPIKSKREISLIEKELSKRNIRNQLIWVLGINSGLRVSDIYHSTLKMLKTKTTLKSKKRKPKSIKGFH